MITFRTIDLRKNLKQIVDKVLDGEKVLISRPHNKNIVLITETEFNELVKVRNHLYEEKIKKSLQQVSEGKIVTVTMEELEEMAK